MTWERVDTLIAFATEMLGISLLITILNQMVAALLGHRATYLKACNVGHGGIVMAQHYPMKRIYAFRH